jgi:hypothetical protein
LTSAQENSFGAFERKRRKRKRGSINRSKDLYYLQFNFHNPIRDEKSHENNLTSLSEQGKVILV